MKIPTTIDKGIEHNYRAAHLLGQGDGHAQGAAGATEFGQLDPCFDRRRATPRMPCTSIRPASISIAKEARANSLSVCMGMTERTVIASSAGVLPATPAASLCSTPGFSHPLYGRCREQALPKRNGGKCGPSPRC
jgi:hypothetical protein